MYRSKNSKFPQVSSSHDQSLQWLTILRCKIPALKKIQAKVDRCTIADKSFFLLQVISSHSYCPLSGRQVDDCHTTTPPHKLVTRQLSFFLYKRTDSLSSFSLFLVLSISVSSSPSVAVSLLLSFCLSLCFFLFVCLSVSPSLSDCLSVCLSPQKVYSKMRKKRKLIQNAIEKMTL